MKSLVAIGVLSIIFLVASAEKGDTIYQTVGKQILAELSKIVLKNATQAKHSVGFDGRWYKINATNISLEAFDVDENQVEILNGTQTGKSAFNMVLRVNLGSPMLTADVEYVRGRATTETQEPEPKTIKVEAYGVRDWVCEIPLQFNTRWKVISVEKVTAKQLSTFMMKSDCSESDPRICDQLHISIRDYSFGSIWTKIQEHLWKTLSAMKLE